MYDKLTIRISKGLYKTLKEEAAKSGNSMAELVRQWLEISTSEGSQNFLYSPALEKESNHSTHNPLVVETVLLLRELILQRDSQILRKVDGELDQLFGPERKRIYEN